MKYNKQIDYTGSDFSIAGKYLKIDGDFGSDLYALANIESIWIDDADDNKIGFKFSFKGVMGGVFVTVSVNLNTVDLWHYVLSTCGNDRNGIISDEKLSELVDKDFDKSDDDAVSSEVFPIIMSGLNEKDGVEAKENFIANYHKWIDGKEKDNDEMFIDFCDGYQSVIDAICGVENKDA